MTIIEGFGAFIPAPARTQDAANKHSNWLRQMELAQMAAMTAAMPQPVQTTSAALALGGAGAAGAPGEAAGAQPVHHDAAAPLRAGQHGDSPAAGGHAPADAGPADRNPAKGAHARAGEADHAATDAQSPSAGAADASRQGAARQPSPVRAAEAAGVQAPAARPAGAPAPSQAAASAMPAAVAGGPAARGLPRDVLPATDAIAAARRTAQSFGLEFGATELPSAEQAAAGHQAEPVEAELAHADSGEQWKKNTMHLVTRGDQAEVWIRDTTLTPGQVTLIVARLSSDLAAAGLQLREATINGRPSLRERDAESAGDGLFAAYDAFPPITSDLAKESHHGN